MTDIDDLLGRLEAATDEDISSHWAAINEDIATALWGEPLPSGNPGSPKTLLWWDRGIGRSVPPDFVRSTDVVVAILIPAGWQWEVHSIPTDEGTTCCAAVNWLPNGKQYAATPALALTIAALKARRAAIVR